MRGCKTFTAELSGWCLRECGDVFRSWCIHLVNWVIRDVAGLPSLLWWTDARVGPPRKYTSCTLSGTSQCSEEISKHKNCNSFWILKLSVLFNRTVLADLSQGWEQLLERKTAKNYTRKLILMANIYWAFTVRQVTGKHFPLTLSRGPYEVGTIFMPVWQMRKMEA